MNITSIQQPGNILYIHPGHEKQIREINLPQATTEKPSETEELLMQPDPVSTEERLAQGISPEDLKNLLAIVMGAPPENHKVDISL